jgi:EpsI family protein
MAGRSFRVADVLTKGFFVPIFLILIAQATAMRVLSIPERELPLPGLNSVPFKLGAWRAAEEQAMDPAVSDYLKPDEYVIRNYVGPRGENVNLFLAYFKSLQNTYGPHSPSVCLPGAGWLVLSSKLSSISLPNQTRDIPVNEFVLERGGYRILTLYWYQNNRDIWAEEFQAKLKLLPDLLRYHRSDVSLVRLIIPLQGTGGEQERMSCMEFIRLLFPKLVECFGQTA